MTKEEKIEVFESQVVKRSKTIERLLEQNYGAVGKGIFEKAKSVEDRLESAIFNKLRFIAAVRNKVVHEEGYVFDGRQDDYLSTCDGVIRRLSNPAPPKQTYAATPPPPRARRTTGHTSRHRAAPKGGPRAASTSAAVGGLVKVALVVATVAALVYAGSSLIGPRVETPDDQSSQGSAVSQQTVWKMMGVNTSKLNVRSGPSADSPVVAQFERGARLTVTGEPVSKGQEQWIRVSDDEGKTQGWANLKFLSPVG